jgi:hypothetical protein
VYYLLYANDEEPSLGHIRVDSVAPPHSPASIKRCISRVEKAPALAHADLYTDISCDTPLKEGYISILSTDGPGLSPDEPMAIVQMPVVQVESASIPDGRYIIKSRAGDIYWTADHKPMTAVCYWIGNTGTKILTGRTNTEHAKDQKNNFVHVSEHSPII